MRSPLMRSWSLCALLLVGCASKTPPASEGTPDSGLPDAGRPDAGLPDGGDGGVDLTLDTDGDGIPDAIEDANHNGLVDPGETDPHRVDTDCDGLVDGPDQPGKGWRGEDQNANGQVDPGETNPVLPDSDHDGLPDGLELGLTASPDPSCTAFVPDGDPTTHTDPLNPDSDGDGIEDGTEDSNHNGVADPGEGDPQHDDSNTSAAAACAVQNLRPVRFEGAQDGDLRVGVSSAFAQIADVIVAGKTRGVMGYDAADQVAFLAFSVPAFSSDVNGDEAATRPLIAATGALSDATLQTFTSWNGLPSLRTFYTQASSADLVDQTNAIANQLLGAGAGVLTGSAGVGGNFQLEVEYVHRSAQELAVVVALAPASLYGQEHVFFATGDTAGGSALAAFFDTISTRCETFTSPRPAVDFLFVVDDSGSMGAYQDRLGTAASAMAAKLDNAYLDWRIAMVTTYYHVTGGSQNSGVLRGFTRNIDQFQSWLTQNSNCNTGSNTCSLPASTPTCNATGGYNGGCWVGSYYSGDEGPLGAARLAVENLSPPTATEQASKFRQGAQVVIVTLGDADDQTYGLHSVNLDCASKTGGCEDVQDFVTFFSGASGSAPLTQNPLGTKIPVNGIICPRAEEFQFDAGTYTAPYACSTSAHPEGEYNPAARRTPAVINATGGILGDITSNTGITNTINQIVDNTIDSVGHRLAKPPIGASIKVVLEGVQDGTACPKANAGDPFWSIPRSRQNGFDFDGLTEKLSFFGGCRPATPDQTQASVSYRSWVENTACPADCGGCPTDYFCEMSTCTCYQLH